MGFTDAILSKLLTLPGIIIGLCFHEAAHAKMSDKLGDPTPSMQGRVTLNPMAHIDVIGFISLILFGFGWGKPVMIDPRYYKHPRRDVLLRCNDQSGAYDIQPDSTSTA